MARLPTEPRLDQFRVGHYLGGVSGPSGYFMHIESVAGDTLNRGQHFSHRKTMTITAIGNQTLASLPEIINCLAMRHDKVTHMDVVTDAGTIRRWIVGSEYIDVIALTECGLARHLD